MKILEKEQLSGRLQSKKNLIADESKKLEIGFIRMMLHNYTVHKFHRKLEDIFL